MQHRAAQVEAPDGTIPRIWAVHEEPVTFCPFCGMNIRRWYGDRVESLLRSDLAIGAQAPALAPRPLPTGYNSPDRIGVPVGDVIAVSRLLWDIGSQVSTSHQHQVDCFHWAAVLDHRVGLPPHPTPGEPTEQLIAFYEGVRHHLALLVAGLRGTVTPPSLP